jgi:hypothetical protein
MNLPACSVLKSPLETESPRWGKSRKRSARTRSWEIATKAARKLEEELEREASGIETPKPPNHVTIDSALELYLLER